MRSMATDRRRLLAGLAAGSLLAVAPAVRAGESPRYLSSRRTADGASATLLDGRGLVIASHRLPGRGHGAAVSPGGQAVLFARRPGSFALALDIRTGAARARFSSPGDRHFYGHGFFSADGRWLYATENDFDNARGVLGVYDAASGYRRIGELETGGTGPHQTALLRSGPFAAVANGGIETHPDWPRRKLNLPGMQPSLAVIDLRTGRIAETYRPPETRRMLSIRHLAVSAGAIWFACQDQAGSATHQPLLGVWEPGSDVRLVPTSGDPAFQGYIGSVAVSADGRRVAATSPRGGIARVWDTDTLEPVATYTIPDVCGVAGDGNGGFIFTNGRGECLHDGVRQAGGDQSWDNHLLRL